MRTPGPRDRRVVGPSPLEFGAIVDSQGNGSIGNRTDRRPVSGHRHNGHNSHTDPVSPPLPQRPGGLVSRRASCQDIVNQQHVNSIDPAASPNAKRITEIGSAPGSRQTRLVGSPACFAEYMPAHGDTQAPSQHPGKCLSLVVRYGNPFGPVLGHRHDQVHVQMFQRLTPTLPEPLAQRRRQRFGTIGLAADTRLPQGSLVESQPLDTLERPLAAATVDTFRQNIRMEPRSGRLSAAATPPTRPVPDLISTDRTQPRSAVGAAQRTMRGINQVPQP